MSVNIFPMTVSNNSASAVMKTATPITYCPLKQISRN